MIHFDIPKIKEELDKLQSQTLADDFWNDPKNSSNILTKIKRLQNKQDNFEKLKKDLYDLIDMNDLLISSFDKDMSKEIIESTDSLQKKIEKLELETLLSGKYDKNNAIISLHPGAGGTESQDWAEMLYRMYAKWASSNGFEFKELDYLEGEEAGLKSVTALVSGENAYGYLKCEKGVHRLVRISPFDSGGRRHTSFASLEVLPEITDDVEIDINPDDLRIDTYRASRSWTVNI